MATLEHWIWHEAELAGDRAVVVDLDGVLADASGRQFHLESTPPNWQAFFSAAGDDALIGSSAAVLAVLDPTVRIVLLTGRPLRIVEDTRKWLDRYSIPWDLLIMRNKGNYQKAREFKRETLRALKAQGWNLLVGFEDDALNCEMFEEEGVPCVYIHSGYYEQRLTRYPSADNADTDN